MEAAAAWERLSLYESKDFIERFFRDRHGRVPSGEKALATAASFAQGREYFLSARKSGELVRPLLIYYGVTSLARGAILFLDPRTGQIGGQPGHGMQTVGWDEALSRSYGGIRQLPGLIVRFSGGTLNDLAKVTRNLVVVKSFNPTERPNVYVGSDTLPKGDTVSFRDLLSRMPDLQEIYRETFSDYPRCYSSSISRDGGTATLNIYPGRLGLPSTDRLREDLHLTAEHQIAERNFLQIEGYLAYSIDLGPVESAALPWIVQDKSESTYFTAPLPGNAKLSTLSLLYMTAYIHGMIARYWPASWLSLLSRASGDFMYPLIKAASRLAEQRFPVLILEELERKPT